MKKKKKFRSRFTMNMNQNDPVQIETINILNTKGRHISRFVAEAVTAYTRGNEAKGAFVSEDNADTYGNDKNATPEISTTRTENLAQ